MKRLVAESCARLRSGELIPLRLLESFGVGSPRPLS